MVKGTKPSAISSAKPEAKTASTPSPPQDTGRGKKPNATDLATTQKKGLADRDLDMSGMDFDPLTHSPGGIPIRFQLDASGFQTSSAPTLFQHLQLHLTLARLQLLRGFDELLCLDGLCGVEHLPHQIETVRKVLRRFRGRVLLADEVGLGKTIEACLLLREYLLRRLVKRVLILVPNPLVSQWQEELSSKFQLTFDVPPRTRTSSSPQYWKSQDRVLVSTSFARTGGRMEAIASANWDLVVVDEAHHCRNRSTKLWKLVNSLKRQHMFLLTATPVQNNLVELYNLLTLLEPGHLKTEADFKRQFVTRGNPQDPRNRERLRGLLSEVMVRNTRSSVQIDLPPRYAQTIQAIPREEELQFSLDVEQYLRQRMSFSNGDGFDDSTDDSNKDLSSDFDDLSNRHDPENDPEPSVGMNEADGDRDITETSGISGAKSEPKTLSRMRMQSILLSLGSHPSAVAGAIEPLIHSDDSARQLWNRAQALKQSAKDEKLLELLRDSTGHKVLVFVASIRTLHGLQSLLQTSGIKFSTFSGEETSAEKDAAVEALKNSVDVMLCTESGGEGRNLQFADTLINYDLPWNPMKIEQRIGRIHRYGQKQDVFIFNLCTAGSVESKILSLLNDKIRMFELVVGEVGSILGNLDEGQEFESIVMQMWQRSGDSRQLDREFEQLGQTLVTAQEKYLDSKKLDEALFGDDYE